MVEVGVIVAILILALVIVCRYCQCDKEEYNKRKVDAINDSVDHDNEPNEGEESHDDYFRRHWFTIL
jgi:hypothetical protein